MEKRKKAHSAVYFFLILILALVMLYSGLRILESTVFSSDEYQEPTYASKTIVQDGKEYYPRNDITVLLAMGIDEYGPVTSSGAHRNNGEADAVILMILDHTQETYSLLCLNRDTMVTMPALGVNGRKAGTYYGQLALAHTYGEGLKDSCVNTREAVSDLLGGITINHYVALNMDGISVINDAVGGVTVHVTEDFSLVDRSIPMGTVTLNGSQAMHYVQSRMNVGNQLNITRMERHKDYMEGLMSALREKKDDSKFIAELHAQVEDYVVTDCSTTVISNILSRCADYTLAEVISPEGENKLTEQFYEFYVDEEALADLCLRLFYAPKAGSTR